MGAHLDLDPVKGLFGRGKRLYINVLELKAVFLALKQFRGQCQNETLLIASNHSTVLACVNKRRNSLSGNVCSPVASYLSKLSLTGCSPALTGVVPESLPEWNVFIVLNKFTKAPFEPMKDTDLKHLSFKTAFVLALASGSSTAKSMPGLQTKCQI